jgi:hypothetical protein
VENKHEVPGRFGPFFNKPPLDTLREDRIGGTVQTVQEPSNPEPVVEPPNKHFRLSAEESAQYAKSEGDTGGDRRYGSVAELFADPPQWITNQLRFYRRNPENHIGPLCCAVAAVVHGDGLKSIAVREEVEAELKKCVAEF